MFNTTKKKVQPYSAIKFILYVDGKSKDLLDKIEKAGASNVLRDVIVHSSKRKGKNQLHFYLAEDFWNNPDKQKKMAEFIVDFETALHKQKCEPLKYSEDEEAFYMPLKDCAFFTSRLCFAVEKDDGSIKKAKVNSCIPEKHENYLTHKRKFLIKKFGKMVNQDKIQNFNDELQRKFGNTKKHPTLKEAPQKKQSVNKVNKLFRLDETVHLTDSEINDCVQEYLKKQEESKKANQKGGQNMNGEPVNLEGIWGLETVILNGKEQKKKRAGLGNQNQFEEKETPKNFFSKLWGYTQKKFTGDKEETRSARDNRKGGAVRATKEDTKKKYKP